MTIGSDAALFVAPLPRVGGLIRGGIIVCLAFFGGLVAWSWFIPLERAAVAPGVIVFEGSRRQVQHLEGGIVGKIFVKEGSIVTAGQTLVVLDNTLSSVQVELLRSQQAAAGAQAARLRAEVEGNTSPYFPQWLFEAASNNPEIEKILDGQQRLFDRRSEALNTSLSLVLERDSQTQQEITGLRAEISGQNRQLELIAEETKAVSELVSRGLERMPRLLLLQRQQAELEGARGQNIAKVARAELSMNEIKLKQLDMQNQFRAEAATKLQDEENRLSDTTEKLRVAEDTLRRAAIKAPVAGKVLNLKVFTEGGVTTAREPIMEIAPLEDRLVIDAHVSTNDIDAVQTGMKVKVRFPSLNSRQAPVLNGSLIEIAADRQTDARTGVTFYTARVTVEQSEFERLGGKIYPGMPVDVTILVGARSLVNYLVEPLFAWYAGSLREK